MPGPASNLECLGWRKRVSLGAPYPLARAGSGIYRNVMALRPVDWRAWEAEPPQNLAFTLTEYCNSACRFCGYRFGTPRRQMSNGTFSKAASEYHRMGGRSIWLNAMTGEPLLDPHFFEKMAFMRSLGSFDEVNLTTNAIMMSRDGVAEGVVGSGITHVVVSTAGFDRDVYSRYMGVDRYDDFLAGLSRLLRLNEEAGLPLDITVGMRGLTDAMDTGDFHDKVLPHIEAGKGRVRVEFLRFYTDWVHRVKKEDLPAGCGLLPKVMVRKAPCPISFNLAVLANGDLRVCNCHYGDSGQEDELCIGNVLRTPLDVAWGSEEARRVRASTYGRSTNGTCRQCLLYPPYPAMRAGRGAREDANP